MGVDPKWAHEFDGFDVAAADIAEPEVIVGVAVDHLEAGELEDCVGALARLACVDPAHGATYRELAGVVHLLREGELRAALARMAFSLVVEPPVAFTDALAKAIAEGLEASDDVPWATLAWEQHQDGTARIERALDDKSVAEEWVDADGYAALEDLAFDLADESKDACWLATSALIASRQFPLVQDPETILDFAAAAVAAEPTAPRARAVSVRVALNLERDDDARRMVLKAESDLTSDPVALLEFLDGAAIEGDFPDLVAQLHAHVLTMREADPRLEEQLRVRRHSAGRLASVPAGAAVGVMRALRKQPRMNALAALSDVVGIGLPVGWEQYDKPEPERETWEDIKRRGDADFRQWMRIAGIILVCVVSVIAWLLEP